MADNEVQFTLPEDPAARAEIEKILKQSAALPLEKSLAKKVKAPPRYVFAESGAPRIVDSHAQVSNSFEQRGGTVIRKLSDTASLVLVDNQELVVHEPEEAWGQ